MQSPLAILLIEEILHQLIGSLSYYLQGFIHPRGAGFRPPTVFLLGRTAKCLNRSTLPCLDHSYELHSYFCQSSLVTPCLAKNKRPSNPRCKILNSVGALMIKLYKIGIQNIQHMDPLPEKSENQVHHSSNPQNFSKC